jgi:hypothetical protein
MFSNDYYLDYRTYHPNDSEYRAQHYKNLSNHLINNTNDLYEATNITPTDHNHKSIIHNHRDRRKQRDYKPAFKPIAVDEKVNYSKTLTTKLDTLVDKLDTVVDKINDKARIKDVTNYTINYDDNLDNENKYPAASEDSSNQQQIVGKEEIPAWAKSGGGVPNPFMKNTCPKPGNVKYMFSEEEKKNIPDECKYCYWRETNSCNPDGNCVSTNNKKGSWDFFGENDFNNPLSFKAFQKCSPEVDVQGLITDNVNNTMSYDKICKKCYFDHAYDKTKGCTLNSLDINGKSIHRDLDISSETDQLEFWKCDDEKNRTFYKKMEGDSDFYNLKSGEIPSANLYSYCHYIDQQFLDSGKELDGVPQKYKDMCEESKCLQKCTTGGRILSDDKDYEKCKESLSTNQYLILPEQFNHSKCFP